MENELKILIVEDDPADAIRLTHELRQHGLNFCSQRIETREAFLRSIETQPPDLVLSDHGLPSFSGFAALEIVQEKCPKVPFIFVTGHYDQGLMVEMFESGAAGYVYKNRLQDLLPAIHQAMEEAKHASQPQPEEPVAEDLPVSTTSGRSENSPSRELRLICSRCKKVRTEHGEWEQIDTYLQRHQQATVTLALCPACAVLKQELLDL